MVDANGNGPSPAIAFRHRRQTAQPDIVAAGHDAAKPAASGDRYVYAGGGCYHDRSADGHAIDKPNYTDSFERECGDSHGEQ